jgi:hypothetical protein
MSELSLLGSMGDPDRMEITNGTDGVHKKYFYNGIDTYAYIENGIVTDWEE